ncbi:hypothetical protein M896_081090 [Ordospora colligata OC4]|uniref:Uncharacterized protein n=1 Tax=Ordospora colligata OC4 TaxID=1354746 RepID=A0A0B2UJ59_9MICR|nr:uncharacterized protein M896_081090 [Ordospora colligata OC4]KHN69373.1 hypothetical protein M896_081090 [Ordospora colligata OC4]TBU14887.1 hypothetical protein CWI41_081080 [Ordospora colligata]
MRCIAEYAVSADMLINQPLLNVLVENRYIMLPAEYSCMFYIRQGFLWYTSNKILKVDESSVAVHESKMFVIQETLKVYELPLHGLVNNFKVYVNGSEIVCSEDGRRYMLPPGIFSEVMDVLVDDQNAWIWTNEEYNGKRCLVQHHYIIDRNLLQECEVKIYCSCSNDFVMIRDVCVRSKSSICMPIMVRSKIVAKQVLMMVLTADVVYMEYSGRISSKAYDDTVYDIDIDAYELLTLDNNMDLFDLYIAIFMQYDIEACVDPNECLNDENNAMNIHLQAKIEKYLFEEFVLGSMGDRMVAGMVRKYGKHGMEIILCRLYRKVDDSGKQMLEQWVRDVHALDALKLIVIYFPMEIERYIQMCIDEHREYEINDLIEHYRGSDMMDVLASILLEKNCLYHFCMCRPEYSTMFGDFTLVEKYNIQAQRNRWIEKCLGLNKAKVSPEVAYREGKDEKQAL